MEKNKIINPIYSLNSVGSLGYYKTFTNIDDLIVELKYKGLPESLAVFSNLSIETMRNGALYVHSRNDYKQWYTTMDGDIIKI